MPDPLDATTLLTEIASRLKTTAQTTPALRTLRREYTRRVRDAEPRSVIRLALDLQKAGVVHRFFSDELISNHNGAMEALTQGDIQKLGKEMDSWDQVDCFATIVSGPAWRTGRIGDEVIVKWAHSKDLWWRRAALVCTTKLNVKGTTGDAKRTLAVCEILIDDREDMVVKAMSWALRALAQRDAKSAKRFVERHRSKLAARVLREVGNKLRTGLKSGCERTPGRVS